MREMKLSIFVSPGFLCGLFLLLLNDLILKATLHNWITGKLSGFAGLFVFPLFWSALFPRFRLFVYFLTGITFFFWKSIYSQPLIDAWNGLAVLPLARTVDATDLAGFSKNAELRFEPVDLIQRIGGNYDARLIPHRQRHLKAAGHGRAIDVQP